MIRSVSTAATIARMIEQAIAKYQFETMVIGGCPGIRSIASLVISVIIASDGDRMRLTPKIDPTPAKHAARPASGCLPTLANAAAPSGIRIR